ncbi:unnamed protein product [Cuscuta epithymum]|uniref:DUF4283 domain-containing protein n=1 Tax=Cuscuta epithymum TaxID=186058 RepID=A0AAV0GAN2_9ASTE|nr:unnamed protein product [Cuscuta epithymum]
MKVTRWTPCNATDRDSPLSPVWVALDGLPIHLHDARALFSITCLLERPLQIDNLTTNFTRPSIARCCIVLNVLKVLPQNFPPILLAFSLTTLPPCVPRMNKKRL